jgi:hypothetical protein
MPEIHAIIQNPPLSSGERGDLGGIGEIKISLKHDIRGVSCRVYRKIQLFQQHWKIDLVCENSRVVVPQDHETSTPGGDINQAAFDNQVRHNDR